MNRTLNSQWFALVILSLTAVGATCVAHSQPAPQVRSADPFASAAPASNGADAGGNNSAARQQVTVIAGLCDARGAEIDGKNPSDVGLTDVLWVVLRTKPVSMNNDASRPGAGPSNPPVPSASAPETTNHPLCGVPATAATNTLSSPFDPSQYVLFINGQPLSGVPAMYDSSGHALGFRLIRNATNAALWSALLGSPTATSRVVTVALGIVDSGGHSTPTIVGTDGAVTFHLRVFSLPWLITAVIVTALLLVLVFGTARNSTTLRDNLLPQLPAKQQPYSLGRCQMAFWFVLVFASFLFLYILLWDYNTVSPQALALMGISSATALASVAVDVAKDSPADAANRGLQALGLTSFADVQRLDSEIASRKAALPNAQSAALMSQLQSEIRDRENIKRTWEDKTRPFLSQGIWRDLTTDINGPTVHRMQVIFWTIALGVVFVVGVYRDLAMPPDFSSTLMALMGISGASYVGFKYPESNN